MNDSNNHNLHGFSEKKIIFLNNYSLKCILLILHPKKVMVFCWMLLLSEKSETHLSYRNTCKLPSQKKIRSIGWL